MVRHPEAPGRRTGTPQVVTYGTGLTYAVRGMFGSATDVRRYTVFPPPYRVSAGNVVVVDLLETAPPIRSSQVDELARSASVLLVSGPGHIDGDWLQVLAQSRAHLIYCDGSARRGGFGPVLTAIGQRLGQLPREALAREIVAKQPSLLPLEDMVAVVCGDPWGIRRPRDLARACQTPLRAVVRRCRSAGFRRAEYVITAARSWLCEVLVGEHNAARRSANLLAGISDASNLRRQVARARPPGGTQAGTTLMRLGVITLALLSWAAANPPCRAAGRVSWDNCSGRDASSLAAALGGFAVVLRKDPIAIVYAETAQATPCGAT